MSRTIQEYEANGYICRLVQREWYEVVGHGYSFYVLPWRQDREYHDFIAKLDRNHKVFSTYYDVWIVNDNPNSAWKGQQRAWTPSKHYRLITDLDELAMLALRLFGARLE